MSRPAIFLDKDGTLIEDLPFNVDIRKIRLTPGVGPALARLHAAGYALIVVSNQAGVALGHYSTAAVEQVRRHLEEEFAAQGIALAGFYFCPHHPDGSVEAFRQTCLCRKPQPGMILQAAREHEIDLSKSWFIGDILDDVEAGRRAGCRTLLMDNGHETEWHLGSYRVPHATVKRWEDVPGILFAGTASLETKSRWKKVRRVLAVRLDAMGDVLMTTPALRAIKRSVLGCQLTLLTSASGANSASYIPEVDHVEIYEAPWMKASALQSGQRDREMIEKIRQGHYEAAVIFTVYSQNPLPAALFCQMADIPLRLAHCRENPYHLLTDWVQDVEPEHGIRHEVQRQLDLVATVGFRTSDEHLSFEVPALAEWQIEERLGRLGVSARQTYLVVHPGATAPSRRYPLEQFAVAAETLAREGCTVIFTGSAQERVDVQRIQSLMQSPSHSLAGQLTLPELAALIRRARVLISNNTGPVHLAAAVGTPVVDLYALTNPQHTPWGVPQRVLFHDVPCKYCYKSVCPQGHQDCLAKVPPLAVVEAARALSRYREPVLEV
jgi:lipopolysaccharide heptosyltransferase II